MRSLKRQRRHAMQINPAIGLLNAQMGLASRVASDASTGPESALAMSRVIAQEMSKLEQNQVQAAENISKSKIADEQSKEKNSNKQHAGNERKKHNFSEEEVSVSTDPLVGNLLNLKI